jgi:hypothetical protein
MRLATSPILFGAVVVLGEVPMLAEHEHIARAIGQGRQIQLVLHRE